MKNKCGVIRFIGIIVTFMIIAATFTPFANSIKPNENEINTTPSGWSEDVRLSYSGNIASPSIAINGSTVHTLWVQTLGPREVFYRRSLDNGRTWEEDKIIGNTSNELPISTSITVNGSTVHAVWDRFTGVGGIEIYYSKSLDNGDTWTEPSQLSEGNSSDSQYPSIACWENNVYLVWLDERNGGPHEAYFKNSSDGGETWSIDRRLTFTAPDSFGKVDIKVNDTNLHVAYDMRVGTPYVFEIFYMNSTDGGVSWSTPVMISQDNDSHSLNIALAINGSDIHIAWRDSKTGSYDIFYRNSTDGGNSFNQEVRLTVNPNGEGTPSIFDDGNNLFVVFTDDRDQPGTGSDLYFKNSTDGGISWTTDTRLTYTAVDEYALDPSIVMVNGMVHVIWEDKRDVSTGETYYKRYPDFPADTTPPTIVHTPVTGTPIDQPINITCQASDNVALSGVWLNYTGVNETNYNVSMTGWDEYKVMVSGLGATLFAQDGNYSFNIPAQDSAGVLSYYIWAMDVEGNIGTSPWGGSYFVQVTGPPSIEISNPVGGEDWTGGSNHQIKFTATDTEDSSAILDVFLNYTSSAGNDVIAQIKGDDSPYDWMLPNIDATDVKINVTVIDSDGNKSYDDSLEFTIDSSPPKVVSTNPVNNTTDISIFQPIVISFNEKMNVSSVIVNQTNGTDPGNWQWFWNEDKDTITGIHDAWPRGEKVEITVQAGYMDYSDPGNANNTAYVFSFTTETNPSPEILHSNISGAQELGDEIRINATITDDGTVMNGVLWWQDVDSVWHENYMSKNGDDWEYSIPGQMKEGKIRYQINATDDLQQKNTTIIYEFDIEDTAVPVIVHTPVKNAIVGESINITCQVTDLGGVSASAVYFVYRYGGDSEFMVESMNSGYWFEVPAQSIPITIEYYVQASDIYGNDASTQIYSLEIIDPSIPDTTPLEILLATPAGDKIPVLTDISLVFNEDMNQTSVENAIDISPDVLVDYSWNADSTVLTITPTANLSYNTTYNVTIGTGAEDIAGNSLESSYAWEFTTELEPVTNGPGDGGIGEYWWIIMILIVAIVVSIFFFQRFRKEK